MDELGWPVQEIRSLQDLRRVVEPRMRYTNTSRYLFRGQARAEWSLVPSLARLIGNGAWTAEKALQLERDAIDLFVPAAQPYLDQLERPPAGLVEWWSVMQHYGVPTRTMDWSADPYVALYFAVTGDIHSIDDGAVWLVHPASVQAYMRKRYGSKHAQEPPGPDYYSYPAGPEHLFFGDVLLRSARSHAQKGMFSWCRRIRSDHARAIARALARHSERENVLRKLIVPSRLKPELADALTKVELSERHLVPDYESGLSQAALQTRRRLGLET